MEQKSKAFFPKLMSILLIAMGIFLGIYAFFAHASTWILPGGDTWDNTNFLSGAFWANDPSSGDIIQALYGTNPGDTTAYTQGRDSNNCDPNGLSVVHLLPGSDTIPEHLNGNTIYVLDSGDYTISYNNGILLDANCIGLVGSGDVTLYSQQNLDSNSSMISVDAKQNIIFDNLQIDGYHNGHSSHHPEYNDYGIKVSNGSTNTIINNIQSFNNIYGLYINNSNNNIISNSQAYANATYGIFLSSNSNNNFINNSRAYNNISAGIFVSESNGNSINNSQAYTNAIGIFLGPNSNNNFINDSQVYTNGNGIDISSSNGTSISGVQLSGNTSDGIEIDNGANNNNFSNIEATNNSGNGITFNGSSSNTISDSKFFNNHFGIFLSSSTDNTISGDDCFGNLNGILLTSSSNNNTINNSTLHNNTSKGIAMSSSNNNIINDSQADTNDIGIHIYGGNDNAINSSETSGNANNGVLINSDSSYNTIYNIESFNNGEGIHIDALSGNMISGGQIHANGLGIVVNSDYVTITNANTYDNQGAGLQLYTSSHDTLTNIYSYTNDGEGILLETSSNNNVLSGIQSYNNSSNGIALNSFSSGNTVNQSTTHHNASDGIYFDSSSNNIINNSKAYNNNQDGIALDNNSNNNTIGTSQEYANVGNGINIASSNNNSIQSSQSYTNTGNGVGIDNGSGNIINDTKTYDNDNGVVIINNSVHNSIDRLQTYTNTNGIYLESSYNSINNTQSNNNSNAGLYIFSSQNNTISNCKIFANDSVGLYFWYGNAHTIKNSQIYNNLADGVYSQNTTDITLQGVQAYNNSSAGINLTNGNSNNINNSQAYNNNTDGIAFNGETSDVINNTQTYNNGSNGTNIANSYSFSVNNLQSYNNLHGLNLDGNDTITYFGPLKLFANTSNVGINELTQGVSDSTLGWATGSIETGGSMDCSRTTNPVSTSGTNLQTGTLCDTQGQIASWTSKIASNYRYGTNLFTQIRPVARSNDTDIILYGTNGVDYDTSRYIGQYGGIGGTFNINSNSVITYQNIVTLSNTIAGANQMRFSNDGSSRSSRETYASTKSRTMNATSGVQIVYGEFSGANGIYKTMDTILLGILYYVPNQFSFTSISGVAINTPYTSNTITLSGMSSNVFTGISLSKGSLYKNGTSIGSSGTGGNGDSFYIILNSSGTYSTTVTTVMTIAGVSASYSITTDHMPISWDNNNFINAKFWAQSPSSDDIIHALYGNGGNDVTAYTKTWDANACNPANMTVTGVNIGINTLPQQLAANTLYVLNAGDYRINYASGIWLTGCSAIIASGNVNLYSTTQIGGSYAMLYAYDINNTIVDGVGIDGLNDGVGGTHGKNTYGIWLNYTSNSNINNSKIYNNNQNGIQIAGSYNNVSNTQTYNNVSVGVAFSNMADFTDYNSINNVLSYNNNFGVYVSSTNNNSINNSQFYNNVIDGIFLISAYNTTINNTQSYNNAANGISLYSSLENKINNSQFYNNQNGINLNSSDDTTYYGTLKVFANAITTGLGLLIPGTGAYLSTLGWTAGSLITGGSMDCSKMTNPVTTGGNYLQSANLCDTKGKIAPWIGKIASNYRYGADILTQTSPAMRSGLDIALSTTSDIDHSTGRYIGQYAPIGGTFNLNHNSPITYTSSVTGYAYITGAMGVTYADFTSFSIYGGVSYPEDTTSITLDGSSTGTKTIYADFSGTYGKFLTLDTIIYDYPDVSPDQFVFSPVTGASLNQLYTSNIVTLTGMTAGFSTGITITTGTLFKNGISIGSSGTGGNGDIFYIKMSSSNASGVTVSSTMTIGGTSSTYSITTVDDTSHGAPGFDCSNATGVSQSECQALVDLYSGTNGAHWTHTGGWLTSTNVCAWSGVFCSYGGVRVLTLSSSNLSGTIPASFGNLTILKSLYLDHNNITSLPSEFKNLSSLQSLYLSNNQLTTLPAEIGNITGLREIWAENNQLTGLPDSLSNIINLHRLYVNANNISSLPNEIGNLTNLQILEIGGNQLTSLPVSIGKLTGLGDLVLAGNQITTFPSSLIQLIKTHPGLDGSLLTAGNTGLQGLNIHQIYIGDTFSGSLLVTGNKYIGYSGSSWNGSFLPPQLATGTKVAVYGETGLAINTPLLTIEAGSTTADLTPYTGTFTISVKVASGTSGQLLSIFRSNYNDGNTWTGNAPDTGCTLDSNKYCTFTTDHLSLFALGYTTTSSYTPNPFTFNSITGANLNQLYTSNTVTLSGMDPSIFTGISITTGTLFKNGISIGSSGTGGNGDIFYIKMSSSNASGVTVSSTMTIGGTSSTYSVTTISTPTGSIVRNNDKFIDASFRAQSPNGNDIINALYGNGGSDTTAYTKNWNTNACNPASMSVQYLASGTNTIPEHVSADTIYVLDSGDYVTNYASGIWLTGCSAIIGFHIPRVYNTNQIPDYGIINANSIQNTVLHNIKIDGYGGSNNTFGIMFVNNANNNTINATNTQYNGHGISLDTSNYVTIANSKIQNNSFVGIMVNSSHDTTITNSNIYYNYKGISEGGTLRTVISDSQVYNNLSNGIEVFSCSGSIINNDLVYNNIENGVYMSSSTNNSFTNTQLYNNGIAGIFVDNINASRYIDFSNIQSYNNGLYGIYVYTTVIGQNIIFNNVQLYNNPNGTYFTGGNYMPTYYGTLQVFSNDNNIGLTGLNQGNGSDYASLGWTTGSINTGGSMDCSRMVNPITASGAYLQTGTLCNSRGVNGGWYNSVASNYRYGNNSLVQISPVTWSGNTIVPYGTNGTDYDTGRYITQYGPIGGTFNINHNSPITYTTATHIYSNVNGASWIKFTQPGHGGGYLAYNTTGYIQLFGGSTGLRTLYVDFTGDYGTFMTLGTILYDLPDVTPDQFDFSPVTGVSLNQLYTSNIVTLTGMTAGFSTGITITTGTLYKNGTNINTSGTGGNDDQFFIALTSSSSYSTTVSSTMTIGGTSGTYSITTIQDTSHGAPGFDCSSAIGAPQAECQVLVDIYSGNNNGSGWSNTSGWLVNTNVCTWTGVMCIANSIRFLSLSNNNLIILPSSISNLPNLVQLNLNNNQLTSLPTAIGNLTNLGILNINNNQLTSLPTEIGNLILLSQLNLNNNQITSLPNSIGNLTSLNIFNMDHNQLTSLPTAIGNLTSLTNFDISNNLLVSLPNTINNLSDLYSLDISNNQLTSLPAGLIHILSSNFDLKDHISLQNNPGLQGINVNQLLTGSTFSGSLLVSGNQYIGYSGTSWDGSFLAPQLATGSKIALTGETGLSINTPLLTIEVGSQTADLLPYTGTFTISVKVASGSVGQSLKIFRSNYNDGNIWTGNTPNTGCVLDINKYCTFRTDHLSLFALGYTTTSNYTPNQFTFTPITGANLNQLYTSNTVMLTGMDAGVFTGISITNGTLYKNGTNIGISGTGGNGDQFYTTLVSSNNYNTTVTITMTIAGVSAPFSITTQNPVFNYTPNQFTFTSITGTELSTWYTSNSQTITGMSPGIFTGITITSGILFKNGVNISTSGTGGNGDVFSIKLYSSNSYATTVSTTMSIGGVTGSYMVMTKTGPICGNGIVEGAEQCDDSNVSTGDGCSNTCQFEVPTCTITNDSPKFTGEVVTFMITASNRVAHYSIDYGTGNIGYFGPNLTGTTSHQHNYASGGTYTVKRTVKNNLSGGQNTTGSCSTTVNIVNNNTPVILGAISGAYYTGTVYIHMLTGTNYSGTRVNGSRITFPTFVVMGLADVVTQNYLTAYNINGNYATLNFFIDNAKPTTTDNAMITTTSGTQIITLTAIDSGVGVGDTLYCIDNAGGTCTPSLVGTSVSVTGSNSAVVHKIIRYYSKDLLGNTEWIKTSAIISIDQQAPQNIGFSINSGSLYTTGTNISLTNITGTDSRGPIQIAYGTSATLTNRTSWATSKTMNIDAIDGLKTIYIGFRDAGGNTSIISGTITLDTTGPIITIYNPITLPEQSKTISGSSNEGTLMQSITAGNTCDGTLSFSAYQVLTFTGESDNGKKICYKAGDTAGNVSYTMSNAISGIDTTAPTITIISPNANIGTSGAVISMNTNEPAECRYSTNSGTAFTSMTLLGGTGVSHSGMYIASEGTNALYAKCKDTAGNMSGLVGISFSVDSLAPIFTGTLSAGGTIVNGGYYNTTGIIITFADAHLSGATLNGSGYTNGALITGNGNYTFSVQDTFGNTTGISFSIDTVNPVITGNYPTSGLMITGASTTFLWSGTDTNMSGYILYINSTGYATTGTSYAVAMSNGAYTRHVVATDRAGNVGTSTTQPFTIAAPFSGSAIISGTNIQYNINPYTKDYVSLALWTNQTANYIVTGDILLGMMTGTIAGQTTISPYLAGADGVKHIYITLSNNSGESITRIITIYLDTTAPTTPTLTLPGSGSAVTGASTFTWNATTDNDIGLSGYQYFISTTGTPGVGIIRSGFTTSTSVAIANGDLSITGTLYRYVRAIDSLNNSGLSVIQPFIYSTLLDTTPDAFSLNTITSATIDRIYGSNTITIAGLSANTPVLASITRGTLYISGNAVGTAGYIQNGWTVKIEMASSSDYNDYVTSTLTIGGISATFRITTETEDEANGTDNSNISTALSSTQKLQIISIFDALKDIYAGAKQDEFLNSLMVMLQSKIDSLGTNSTDENQREALQYLYDLTDQYRGNSGTTNNTNISSTSWIINGIYTAPNGKKYTITYDSNRNQFTSPNFLTPKYFPTLDVLKYTIDLSNPAGSNYSNSKTIKARWGRISIDGTRQTSAYTAPNHKSYYFFKTTDGQYSSYTFKAQKYFDSLEAIKQYIHNSNLR